MEVPFVVTVEDVIPVLPAGIYPARFAKIEQQSNDNGTFWLWTFVARNGDNDVEITSTSSPRITPRTKAAKFLAGLGIPVTVGQQVDFSQVLDTVCQIVVTINDAGYSRIDSVLPYSNPTIAPKGKVK
jgi:hypothetical protein